MAAASDMHIKVPRQRFVAHPLRQVGHQMGSRPLPSTHKVQAGYYALQHAFHEERLVAQMQPLLPRTSGQPEITRTWAGRTASHPGFRARSALAICGVRSAPHACEAHPGSHSFWYSFFYFASVLCLSISRMAQLCERPQHVDGLRCPLGHLARCLQPPPYCACGSTLDACVFWCRWGALEHPHNFDSLA